MNLLSSQAFCLFAQADELEAFDDPAWFDEPARQSYLSWLFEGLGPVYAMLLVGGGLILFLGACLVVALCKRPTVIAAYMLFLLFPILIGLFGGIQSMIEISAIIATSHSYIKPSELAVGASMILVPPYVSLAVTFPSFLVLSVGLFVRTLLHKKNKEHNASKTSLLLRVCSGWTKALRISFARLSNGHVDRFCPRA